MKHVISVCEEFNMEHGEVSRVPCITIEFSDDISYLELLGKFLPVVSEYAKNLDEKCVVVKSNYIRR